MKIQFIFKPKQLYQWTHTERPPPTPITPGRLETGDIWPHTIAATEKKTHPIKSRLLDGESKIPKRTTSTPKPRLSLNLSVVSSCVNLSNASDNNSATIHVNNKVNDFKYQMSKCETVPDMLHLIQSFLESTEETTNNSLITKSVLESMSEFTMFDPHADETIFDVQQRPQTTPTSRKSKISTPSYALPPSLPATPTSSRPDIKRAKRQISVEPKPIVAETICKKCILYEKLIEEKKKELNNIPSAPILKSKVETKAVEIQTEAEIVVEEAISKKKADDDEKSKNVTACPPLPPPLPIPVVPVPPVPPAPPMFGAPPCPPLPLFLGSKATQSNGPGKASTSSSMSTTISAEKPKPLPIPLPASEWYQTNSECRNLRKLLKDLDSSTSFMLISIFLDLTDSDKFSSYHSKKLLMPSFPAFKNMSS